MMTRKARDARHEPHRLPQRLRPARSGAGHDRAGPHRSSPARSRTASRATTAISRPACFNYAGAQPPQPQQAARPGRGRRRHQDRLHPRVRLQPDDQRQDRRPAHRRRRARRPLRRQPRPDHGLAGRRRTCRAPMPDARTRADGRRAAGAARRVSPDADALQGLRLRRRPSRRRAAPTAPCPRPVPASRSTSIRCAPSSPPRPAPARRRPPRRPALAAAGRPFPGSAQAYAPVAPHGLGRPDRADRSRLGAARSPAAAKIEDRLPAGQTVRRQGRDAVEAEARGRSAVARTVAGWVIQLGATDDEDKAKRSSTTPSAASGRALSARLGASPRRYPGRRHSVPRPLLRLRGGRRCAGRPARP